MRLLLVKIQIKENNQDEIIRIKLLTANSQDKPVLHISSSHTVLLWALRFRTKLSKKTNPEQNQKESKL